MEDGALARLHVYFIWKDEVGGTMHYPCKCTYFSRNSKGRGLCQQLTHSGSGWVETSSTSVRCISQLDNPPAKRLLNQHVDNSAQQPRVVREQTLKSCNFQWHYTHCWSGICLLSFVANCDWWLWSEPIKVVFIQSSSQCFWCRVGETLSQASSWLTYVFCTSEFLLFEFGLKEKSVCVSTKLMLNVTVGLYCSAGNWSSATWRHVITN